MSIQKKIANRVLTNLDHAAGKLEELAKSGKMDSRLASTLIHELDAFADRFEIAAYGQKNLQARMAKVLQKDKDESYMDTFENPNKVVESDDDEPYMHEVPPSARWDGIKTFDQDMTSAVSDRDEYAVQGLSEHSEPTKRQPSWTGGPKKHKASQSPSKPKTWAP